MSATLNALARIQQLLATAELEGRDVTQEEIQALRDETDALRKEWNDE